MTQRFQVFTQRGAAKPKFSAPWYWVASMYSTFFCGHGDYCRIMDTKRGETMMEWGRATGTKTRSDR
ncbi:MULTISPECIES: hypothetical protein [Burkholderia]|uniref:hypothetical protein n=1 Tax=Burkholderia TaxID=32008 RepID=UPI0009DE636D|nr:MULTISPECIES: hypothetical protein [Burkholderia]